MTYESETLDMIDRLYAPTVCKCSICEERFYDEDSINSFYSKKVTFCSLDCLDQWEFENKHDYIYINAEVI